MKKRWLWLNLLVLVVPLLLAAYADSERSVQKWINPFWEVQNECDN
jgi:hypothetical protein